MSDIIQYSILRYSPSLLSGETINLGVLIATDEFAKFEYTKRINRIREFDDTLNTDVLRLMLNSIKEEVEGDLLTSRRTFDINSFIKFYCKEYNFSEVNTVRFDNLEQKIDEIKKIYLRFDYDVSQRPSYRDELSFLRSLLSEHGKVQPKGKALGKLNDTVVYDFIVGNYGIKYFSFKSGKDFKKMMNDIKAWAWNCEHYQDIQPIIVYSTDIIDKVSQEYNEFVIIKNIFNSASDNVFSIEDVSAKLDLLGVV